MRTYKGNIASLQPYQIFVFGSNTQGRHGAGAAKWALINAGAIYGQARGLQGQSYAIVTKDLTKKTHPSVLPSTILREIIDLYNYAEDLYEFDFLIPYKANSKNLNGYMPEDMAELFAGPVAIPGNIVFEEGFAELVKRFKLQNKNP